MKLLAVIILFPAIAFIAAAVIGLLAIGFYHRDFNRALLA